MHHATRLLDGRVLLTGGCSQPGCEGFGEAQVSAIYDPASHTFSAGPRMVHPRASGTATLLDDGRVLLTGGYPGEGAAPRATAEVYDPFEGRFEAVNPMTTARADQSASLIDGRVLIAGGVGVHGQPLSSSEWFDPSTDTFTPGHALDRPRAAQTAVTVDHAVLLVGGTQGHRALRSTSVLTAGSVTAGPDLRTARVKLGAAAIGDGQVLVVGGARSTEGRQRLRSTEIIDLGNGRVRPGPPLSEGEYKLDGAVSRVPDGRVAIAGGDHVNIYNPTSDEMTVLPSPAMGTRSFVSATFVGDDQLLVAGGYDPSITPTDEAWLISLDD